MDYAYNAADQRTSLTYPGGNGGQQGELVSYGYNSVGQLHQVSGSGVQYVASTAYNPAGQVTEQRLDVSPNGLLRQYVYETNSLRLNTARAGTASPWTNRQNLSYTYDNAGNVTSFEGAAYAYNDAAHKHAVTHLNSVQKFWYDANGNVTRRINTAGVDISLAYDQENRLITVSGNRTASYAYDGDGNLVKAIDDTNHITTTVVGPHYEVRVRWTGTAWETTVRKYYYAGSVRVAMRDGTTLYFLLSDHLGSTSLTLDSSGNRLDPNAELRYKPYGDMRYNGGGQKTNYRPSIGLRMYFTGQRWDQGHGLYYYGARWYDPYLNRWLQPDTIIPDPGNPQSLNRYSFAGNNPVRYVDSNGHCGPLTPICLALMLGGMALLLQGDSPDLNVTADDIASQRLGGALVVGGAGLTVGLGMAGPGSQTAMAACADGDCTNEVRGAGQAVQNAPQATQSVWKLDPLKRGQEIEKMLGRSPQLTQNFPVIDRFENGVATSIKSIDLGAKSYQNVGTLSSTVKGYVSELANWQGVARWGGTGIRPDEIMGRELLLAIPQGATQAQLAALQQIQKWASTVGVNVNLTVVP